MTVKLLTKHHLEFLSLKWGRTGLSRSTLIKMPHCWKSHAAAQIYYEESIIIHMDWLHMGHVMRKHAYLVCEKQMHWSVSASAQPDQCYYYTFYRKYIIIWPRVWECNITPCNKINKPLVIYKFLGNVMTSITTLHTYWQNYNVFTAEMRFQSKLNVIW